MMGHTRMRNQILELARWCARTWVSSDPFLRHSRMPAPDSQDGLSTTLFAKVRQGLQVKELPFGVLTCNSGMLRP